MKKTIATFYKFIFRYKIEFILSIFFFMLVSVAVNVFPVVMREIVKLVENGEIGKTYTTLVWLIWVIAIEILFHPLAIHFSDIVIFKAARDVRLEVFKHLHNLDFAYHTNKASGALISLFKRGQGAFFNFHTQMNFFNIRIIFDFIFMIGIFAALYPKMVVVTLVVMIINFVVMAKTIKKNIKARAVMNNYDDSITAITVDNMMAFDTVKYFSNESYEQSRLSNTMDPWVASGIEYARTFRIIDLANGSIVWFGMIVVIMISLLDLINGNIQLSDFVMTTTFATTFFPSLFNMVFNFRELSKNYVDLEKYLAVLDEEIEIKDDAKDDAVKQWKVLESTNNYDIEFEDVDFSYNGKSDVLHDINLKIKAGESVAFVGKSGAGKTTITKLLMRFYDPQKGKIKIGGIDIKDLPKTIFRKKIGFVPQETILFNDTIGYNIAYGRETFSSNELAESIKIANLHEFVYTLPDELKTVVGERGIKLSGGQKQRLAIARAIMENAPIIVFDEATSNLDSESEKLIQKSFWTIAKGKTTIIIAHRLSTVMKADRIVVLDKGRIAEIGTHAELTNKKSGIYKHLWGLQTIGEIEE